jgi:NDP-sugar pyrophosphorylase family protein
VDVGAIVLVEVQSRTDQSSSSGKVVDSNCKTFFAGEPLAFVDVLGRSLLEHSVERLLNAGVKLTSLVVDRDIASSMPAFRHPLGKASVRVAEDPWPAIAQILETYRANGCDCAFVLRPTAYMEPDLNDLLDFHRQAERAVTRASDREGPLDLWVMNCNSTTESIDSSMTAALLDPNSFPASYFVKEYVRRISDADDFRQLVTDAFVSRCSLRPMGNQLRPGIWADQGAQIRRGARIVGPAYLGARCTIGERAVVTRFSNIERDSYIDYGTVIENSSVLPNTYVGILLDVRRSIVHGNRLLNLERGVLVEVSDPLLLRANGTAKQSGRAHIRVPKPEHGASLPRTNVVDRIRSINARTEFES